MHPSAPPCASGERPCESSAVAEHPAAACLPADTSSCDGPVSAKERAALDEAIAAANKRVLDTQFGDVSAIIEIGRLQLRRDDKVEGPDGLDDTASALRNGMRAVAVDEAFPSANIVLALALARSFVARGRGAILQGASPYFALDLVEHRLQSVPREPGPTSAAARTIEGYIALERGDVQEARRRFESAVAMDPALGSAWMGRGDAARSVGAFGEAATAYEKAAQLLPDDTGIPFAIDAATRSERLIVPNLDVDDARFSLSWTRLATPSKALPCALPKPTAPLAVKLCDAITELNRATLPDERKTRAGEVLDAAQNILPLCEKHDPACGPDVARGLANASRAFRQTKRIGTALQIGRRLLSQRGYLPESELVSAEIALEVAEDYVQLAMFDDAADHYEEHVTLRGAHATLAIERAFAIRVALLQIREAKGLAAKIVADGARARSQKAQAILAVGAAIRLTEDPEAAGRYLEPHEALLEDVGLWDRATKLSQSAGSTPGVCGTTLACAVRRLAGEERWARQPAVGAAKP